MELQMKIHNLNTKMGRARKAPTSFCSTDLQVIEKESDQLKDVWTQLAETTSALITHSKELGGPWIQEWPELSPESLQQSLFKRGEQVEETTEKVRKFCTTEKGQPIDSHPMEQNWNAFDVSSSEGARYHPDDSNLQNAQMKSGKTVFRWIQSEFQKIKTKFKPSQSGIKNPKYAEVCDLLDKREVREFFETSEGRVLLENIKTKPDRRTCNESDENELGVGQSNNHLVAERLGTKNLRYIVDYCIGGKMNDDALEEFAERLGRDKVKANMLLGAHKTRMSKNFERCRGREMQDILGDWWTHQLHQIPRQAALEQLVKIFDEINACRPLAHKLRGSLEKRG